MPHREDPAGAGGLERPTGDAPAAVADATRSSVRLPRSLLLDVYEHARECYPEECCGLLVGDRGEAPSGVYRCTNVQNRLHAAGKSGLDARHAFWIDETELLTAVREAESAGHQVLAVYHSHVDTGAYLSQADAAGALGPGGTPLWPGVGHLVISVLGGMVREAAYFDWDAAAGGFVGRPVREEA